MYAIGKKEIWSYQLIGQTNLGQINNQDGYSEMAAVSFVNVRLSFCSDDPVWTDSLWFEALPGPRILLPDAREFFTDLACSLVCRSVIAYLRIVRYGRRRPYRIKIHSCGVN